MDRSDGPAGFGSFVRRAADGPARLVVQPRMGFGDAIHMGRGLRATRDARACTVGTITLDSYTRVGDPAAAGRALRAGDDLNGYPVVTHPRATTLAMLDDVRDAGFPVQVRHGSARPGHIFDALVELRLDASEGGPVSYCLPYGRVALADSVENWRRACDTFAGLGARGALPHLETFGGCMLGQLCPPSALVAISLLEGMFFADRGVGSISLSYAQQTNPEQDREAVVALRALAAEHLPPGWHVVIYAYMGVYPETEHGAQLLLGEAVDLALSTGSERLIVKTSEESRRIPTVEENVRALEFAARHATRPGAPAATEVPDPADGILDEARRLVHATLELDPDVGRALVVAFARGHLDVPYCIHPDNAGRARGVVDADGRLRWASTGALPIAPSTAPRRVRADDLLADLSYVRRRFDGADPLVSGPPTPG